VERSGQVTAAGRSPGPSRQARPWTPAHRRRAASVGADVEFAGDQPALGRLFGYGRSDATLATAHNPF